MFLYSTSVALRTTPASLFWAYEICYMLASFGWRLTFVVSTPSNQSLPLATCWAWSVPSQILHLFWYTHTLHLPLMPVSLVPTDQLSFVNNSILSIHFCKPSPGHTSSTDELQPTKITIGGQQLLLGSSRVLLGSPAFQDMQTCYPHFTNVPIHLGSYITLYNPSSVWDRQNILQQAQNFCHRPLFPVPNRHSSKLTKAPLLWPQASPTPYFTNLSLVQSQHSAVYPSHSSLKFHSKILPPILLSALWLVAANFLVYSSVLVQTSNVILPRDTIKYELKGPVFGE